jgi:hypothetical protein
MDTVEVPLPLYMRTIPEEFYEEFINERKAYSKFINKYFRQDIDNILQDAIKYVDNNYGSTTVIWIGGSRSWKKLFDCFGGRIQLHSLELASIIPGNYDIFVLSNDYRAHEEVMCYLTHYFDQYIEAFKDPKIFPIGQKFDVSKNYGNIKKTNDSCTLNFPKEKGSCTLFPCQSLIVSLKTKDMKNHPLYVERKYAIEKVHKQKQIAKKNDNGEEAPLSPFANSVSVLFSDKVDYPLITKNKIMVYCESFVIQGIDIQKFKNKFLFQNCENDLSNLQVNYLNSNGLLLMSEFLKVSRFQKGLNVDQYRKQFLMKVIGSFNVSEFHAYKQIISEYYEVFGQTTAMDTYMIGDLVKRLALSTGYDFENEIGKKMIDALRPYTNSFLKYLSEEMSRAYGDDAFIVMVGGDAMRRYDLNITTTSDFDTKLFVNDNLLRSDGVQTRRSHPVGLSIEEFLIREMSKFVVFLYNEKELFLSSDEVIGMEQSDFKVSCPLLSKGLQFRLRYIEKNDKLPVDLYSIDFRTIATMHVLMDGKPLRFEVPIDVPFLDIVVTRIRDSLFAKKGNIQGQIKNIKTKTVGDDVSTSVPIASHEFLLADLEKTYHSPSLAAGRYWTSKVSKDITRYRRLKAIKVLDYIGIDELNREANPNIWERFGKRPMEELQYVKDFTNKMVEDRKLRKVKHKMGYGDQWLRDTEEEEEEIQEMVWEQEPEEVIVDEMEAEDY